MLALKSLLAVLPFFFGQGVAAAPAPIPSGGVGVRANDTPPVYGAMTDCESIGLRYRRVS